MSLPMPGLVKDIGHILVGVEEMDRALAFYRDLLGFQVVGQADPMWTVVAVPGGQLTLYKQEGVTPIALGEEGLATPISLHVDNFEQAVGVLEDEGERVEAGDAHHGLVWDPFGNVLELHDHRKGEEVRRL
jgi:catechol 2,3-dioxygenase-like lactoylglutathione lyase family enzyme